MMDARLRKAMNEVRHWLWGDGSSGSAIRYQEANAILECLDAIVELMCRRGWPTATSTSRNFALRSPAEAIAELALALIGRDVDARDIANRALAEIAELRAGNAASMPTKGGLE